LAASCIFYAYFIPVYILILFLIIIIDYIAGIHIEKSTEHKKLFLSISIIANLSILCFFKYFNFFLENYNSLSNSQVPLLQFVLPIGLSFHTFQAMSYTIEVYRGNSTAEKHLGIYALYVMFYPQLVAGPIERPQNIIPQLNNHHRFNIQNLTTGISLMIWGFFKKLVIADRLSVYVNIVFENPEQFNSFNLILGAIFFSIQIYCDFSGYSDIALGSARVMGYNLMDNFNFPYFADSIKEFWARWHISLSTWFRDYVYIPMGGNRISKIVTIKNTLVIFLLSGFWHGANWTFIIWGLLNALYIILNHRPLYRLVLID
jgi:D-alanyl-lipoteichoic acid acyltransferase DltB (MBOAT superfamily)